MITDLDALSSYDTVERFVAFLEQLEVAYGLLEADTLAKGRSALILVDNLANTVLATHATRVFASSEGSEWHPRKHYTATERKEILDSRDRLVTLATRDAEGPSWRNQPAILSEADAIVMRVALTYRNKAYHRDSHNKALLGPLTVLYARAVASAFCSQQKTAVWSGYSVSTEQAERLRALGYEPRRDEFMKSMWMLEFADAATTITDRLLSIELDEAALRKWLSLDIVDRCVRCTRLVLHLMQGGMPNPGVSPHAAMKLGKRGERLAQAKNTGALLQNYCKLDGEVDQLTSATLRAVRIYDEIVEAAVDRARDD